MLLLIAGVTIGYGSYSDVVFSVETDEKILALTYDDGPHPVDTPALLDLLDELDVEATFFVTGKHVAQYPEIVKDAHSRGHVIGNHSWTHHPLWQFRYSTSFNELNPTRLAILEAVGYSPKWFRAPYLIQGIGLTRVVKEMEMVSVGGTAVGYDWAETDPERIAGSVLKRVAPGSIIVLHDGDGEAEVGEMQDSRTPTVEATAIIVNQLRKEGYRFVSLQELMEE